jgi:hypothetical protein
LVVEVGGSVTKPGGDGEGTDELVWGGKVSGEAKEGMGEAGV